MITDYATFGWLCDVYIDRAVRGRGLGTALVTEVRDYLARYDLRRVLLATSDAQAVYAKGVRAAGQAREVDGPGRPVSRRTDELPPAGPSHPGNARAKE